MKTLVYFFAIVMLILTSCSREILNDENLDLKKAKVDIPFKGEFCASPDADIYGKFWITGHATHMGELIAEQSYMQVVSVPQPGQPVLMGRMTADNGDYIEWTDNAQVYPDGTITGNVTITGGSGRFANVTGQVTADGKQDPATGIICWTGIGTLTYE